jgi:hypothetical protein
MASAVLEVNEIVEVPVTVCAPRASTRVRPQTQKINEKHSPASQTRPTLRLPGSLVPWFPGSLVPWFPGSLFHSILKGIVPKPGAFTNFFCGFLRNFYHRPQNLHPKAKGPDRASKRVSKGGVGENELKENGKNAKIRQSH